MYRFKYRFFYKCLIISLVMLQALCLKTELQNWLDENNKNHRWELQWSTFQESDRADLIAHLTSLANDSNAYMELFQDTHGKLCNIDVSLGLSNLEADMKKQIFNFLQSHVSFEQKGYSVWFRQARDAAGYAAKDECVTGKVSATTGWQQVLLKSHQQENDPKNNQWNDDDYE